MKREGMRNEEAGMWVKGGEIDVRKREREIKKRNKRYLKTVEGNSKVKDFLCIITVINKSFLKNFFFNTNCLTYWLKVEGLLESFL